jgi:hypothetical protein
MKKYKIKLCTNDVRGVFSPVFIVNENRLKVLQDWQYLGGILLFGIDVWDETTDRQTTAGKVAAWISREIYPNDYVNAYTILMSNFYQDE